jgi:hypothetical protein
MPRLALLLAFLCFSLPVFAEISTDDPYTVSGITVDAKGANGSEARDKAFTDGGRLALSALAVKLTGGKAPDFKAADNNAISRLVKSFEVETEKTSGARYIATLTYHFKPTPTDSFLTQRGMALKDPGELTTNYASGASEEAAPAAPSQKIVVLPIIRTGDRSVLWEEHTDWARAWENYVSDHPNANVVVPTGEMEDINTIAAQEALSGLPGPLTKIMQNYEAQGVLVAVLSAPSITPIPDRDMNVQLSIFDSSASLRSTSSYNLAAAPSRKPMEWLQDGAGTALVKWQSEAQKIASSRKAATQAAAPPGGPLQLAINVPFSSPQQWQAMRGALQETNGVTRFDVVGLSHSKATALITFAGSRAQLEAGLREKGLTLQQDSAGGTATLRYLLQPQVISVPGRTVAPPPAVAPGSTFKTVYPPPAPEPPDEVIYADPDKSDESTDNGDEQKAPPPKAMPKTETKKGVQQQELPPLIP